MRLRVLPSAIGDLLEISRYYEKKEQGLGRYIFDQINSDIESLLITSGVHRKVHGFHRLLCRRFPFAVYYTIDDQVIVVWRILDARPDPQRSAHTLRGLIP